jgi:hypothetical protein
MQALRWHNFITIIVNNLKSPRQLLQDQFTQGHAESWSMCRVAFDGSALLQEHLAKMCNCMCQETRLFRFRHHENQVGKAFGYPSCNVGDIGLFILIEMLLHDLVDIAVEAFGHILNPRYGSGRKRLVMAYSIFPILRATACIVATNAV